jgi:pimeloyl-ACP methyl ester carboxylesterase
VDLLASETRGDGEPIVVLHMFGLDRASMTEAFEPVFGAGWERTYVDLPGSGRSAPVGPSSDAVLEAVIDFIVGLGRPVFLAGASYGGYLAIGVARRRPDLVRGLVLVCSGTRILLADRTVPAGPPKPAEPGWLDGVPEGLRAHLDQAIGTRTRAVADRVAGLIEAAQTDDDYLDRLRAEGYQLAGEGAPHVYAGPVLMVCGREDRVAGYADQLAALAAYPDGTYVAIPGAGHYLPYERPDAFRGVVRGWLDVASGI